MLEHLVEHAQKVQQALDVAIDVLLLEAVLQLVYHLLVEVCAMEKTEDEWSSRSEKFFLEQKHLSNSEKSLGCVVQVKHHHGTKKAASSSALYG